MFLQSSVFLCSASIVWRHEKDQQEMPLAFPQPHVSHSFQWTVTLAEEGLRLDAFLSRHLAGFSRREKAELVTQTRVRINGRPSSKGTVVRSQDIVTVLLTPTLTPNPDLPVSVLHTDPECIVIDKPDGIPSIALRHSETKTVANFLLAHFPETAQVGSHQLEAGLLHRLDTDTSGVMIAARTPAAHTNLQAQFRQRTVTKHYLAIVEGSLKTAGQVTLSLAPSGRHGQTMRPQHADYGHEAVTQYVPIEHFWGHTLVRVSIRTGVRHQIRAHLAALGHPIIGDVRYGAEGRTAPRLGLHAATLAFDHPTTGKRLSFTSPMPENLLAFLEQLRGTNKS